MVVEKTAPKKEGETVAQKGQKRPAEGQPKKASQQKKSKT